MKRAFSIDLNVVRFAATLKNEKGDDDYSSKLLVVSILKLCNTLFIPDKRYISRYIKLISELGDSNEFIDSEIFSLWRDFWTTEGKLDWLEDEPSALEEEGMFDADDRDFVRMAAHIDNGIVFVTTDNRLIRRLNDLKMTKKYGFDILRPENAMKYVGEKD